MLGQERPEINRCNLFCVLPNMATYTCKQTPQYIKQMIFPLLLFAVVKVSASVSEATYVPSSKVREYHHYSKKGEWKINEFLSWAC